MGDTLHRAIYNATTAGAAGAAVDPSTGHGAVVAALAGILAPVLRDVIVNLLSKLFKKRK